MRGLCRSCRKCYDAELNGNDSDTLVIYHYSGNNGVWDAMTTTAWGSSGEGRWVEGEIGPANSPFVLKSDVPTFLIFTDVNGRGMLWGTLLIVGMLAASVVVYHPKRNKRRH